MAVSLIGGKTVVARVTGEDPAHDLAVLQIPTAGVTLHPLPLGSSIGVQVGDSVVAIGDPFGLERTVTTGVVSALRRRITSPNGTPITDALQTGAAINPGSSGGSLLSAAGEVVGINSQIETNGDGGSVGIAFAIPIDVARRELAALRRGN